jgi:hypothetical protein
MTREIRVSERPISDRFGTRRNELVMSLVIEKPFRKRRNELVEALMTRVMIRVMTHIMMRITTRLMMRVMKQRHEAAS